MRRFISIALIVILAAQSFYQLGVLLYFQFNREYIATELCINRDRTDLSDAGIVVCGGQCFVDEKLKLADHPSSSEEKPILSQKVELPTFILVDTRITTQPQPAPYIHHCTRYSLPSTVNMAEQVFHPPA